MLRLNTHWMIKSEIRGGVAFRWVLNNSVCDSQELFAFAFDSNKPVWTVYYQEGGGFALGDWGGEGGPKAVCARRRNGHSSSQRLEFINCATLRDCRLKTGSLTFKHFLVTTERDIYNRGINSTVIGWVIIDRCSLWGFSLIRSNTIFGLYTQVVYYSHGSGVFNSFLLWKHIQLNVIESLRSYFQWRIYTVKFWMRAPPPSNFNFLHFMQFSGKFGWIIG